MKKLLNGSIVILSMAITNMCGAIPVTWSGNGSQYEAIAASSISWADSRAGAQALGAGWDLVTITSLDEQLFIASLLGPADGSLVEYYTGGVYVGGEWGWITGESFDFTYWGGGEPNGNASEPFIALDGRFNFPNWGWNDFTGAGANFIAGYVAERQGIAEIPEPATFALLGLGLIGLSSSCRRKIKKI